MILKAKINLIKIYMQKQSLDFSILLMELFISFILLVIILLPTSHTSLVQSISSSSFTKSYHSVKQWGSSGSGNGQFSNPHGIAIDSSGNVYVADSNNDRIQKFDNNGTFIKQWGSSGSGNGQFSNPHGIAIDSSGNVYVADSGNKRIQKSNGDGNVITTLDTGSKISAQFHNPIDIAADLLGILYVVDGGNNRIDVFAPTVQTSSILDNYSGNKTSLQSVGISDQV
jgi:DNA-binding beta-propeller fold protein YncE